MSNNWKNILAFLFALFAVVLCRPSRSCDHCLPGWGVVTPCNSTHPTVCRPCQSGYWSPRHPHLKTCRLCSKCGDGLYIYRGCTPTHDTQCGSCAEQVGHFTEDFVRKCLERQDVPVKEQSPALKMFFEEVKRTREQAKQVPDDGDIHHEFWKFESNERLAKDESEGNEFKLKPGYHQYHLSRLLLQAHKRKAYVLLGLTAFVLMATIAFACCFIRTHCTNDAYQLRTSHNQLYVHLSEHDEQMIRECANRLRHSGKNRMESISTEPDEWWEDDPTMNVTENPLEQYLHSSQQSLLPRKEES